MSKPLVTIVIPTHNRKFKVVRLLRSILAGSYTNVELLIVDDASSDGTSEAIKNEFVHNKHIQIILNKINQYAAGSRNIGTKRAKGKYIFYVDDDNVLDKNALSELVDIFEADKKIGELGLVNKSFRDKKTVLWLKTIRNMWTTKTYLPTKTEELFKLRAWNTEDVPNAFMVRADVIKNFGISFCPKFGIMYEESDVAYRIREAGYSIKVSRDAVVYHDVDNYMQHFVEDIRMPFVFARNRIIFHSIYSSHIQLVGIISLWIWVFMLFYWYKVLGYNHEKNITITRKLRLMFAYFKGNLDGIWFVLRNEQLIYPKIN